MRKSVSKSANKKSIGTHTKARKMRKKATSRSQKMDAKISKKDLIPEFPRSVNPNAVADPAHAFGHRHLKIKF